MRIRKTQPGRRISRRMTVTAIAKNAADAPAEDTRDRTGTRQKASRKLSEVRPATDRKKAAEMATDRRKAAEMAEMAARVWAADGPGEKMPVRPGGRKRLESPEEPESLKQRVRAKVQAAKDLPVKAPENPEEKAGISVRIAVNAGKELSVARDPTAGKDPSVGKDLIAEKDSTAERGLTAERDSTAGKNLSAEKDSTAENIRREGKARTAAKANGREDHSARADRTATEAADRAQTVRKTARTRAGRIKAPRAARTRAGRPLHLRRPTRWQSMQDSPRTNHMKPTDTAGVTPAAPVTLKPGERIDDLQRNGARLIQNPDTFCFGMDAVLLSAFAEVNLRPGMSVLDLCTGNGIIPILMDARWRDAHPADTPPADVSPANMHAPGSSAPQDTRDREGGSPRFLGLELNPVTLDMARRSAILNGRQSHVHFDECDIRTIKSSGGSIIKPAAFKLVTVNPPYMPAGHGLTGKNDALTSARHETTCSLDDVCAAAEYALAPLGKLCMVHRPFRLADIFRSLSAHHLEPKRLRMVQPAADKKPNMVLIEAVRGGRPRLSVEKTLIIYEKPGTYTEEVRSLYG